ncbi:MAG: hypothetical protein PHX47_03500 [Candidatus ainarchaeum sp.]|nr:hypothetical protein [Candidatus ainarchaeum sp.]
MEYKSEINKIKLLKKELRDVPVSYVIEGSTQKKVLEFNENDIENKKILNELKLISTKIINEYKQKYITREIYNQELNKKTNAFRNNEVGDYCEYIIVKVFKDNKKEFLEIKDIIKLSSKGYPDLKIITTKKTIFVEVKATSKPDIGSPRDFYYTAGANSDKKINIDAHHLLIGFITKEEEKNKFHIIGYKIVDVSKIKVSLKPEFNTDNKGIYNKETVIYKE